MLEPYMDNPNFIKWVDYNSFISKLTGDPLIFSLYLDDNRICKIIFLNGKMFNYKYFIYVFSRFSRHMRYYSSDYKKQTKHPDYQIVRQALAESEIFSINYKVHPYHKKAKPTEIISKGPRYGYVENKIEEMDSDKLYYINDILNGNMEMHNE